MRFSATLCLLACVRVLIPQGRQITSSCYVFALEKLGLLDKSAPFLNVGHLVEESIAAASHSSLYRILSNEQELVGSLLEASLGSLIS